jgi:DNA repair photolyase
LTPLPIIQGRGTQTQPPNRFDQIVVETDGDWLDDTARSGEIPTKSTVYLRDSSRSIIAENDSPDVGFSHSINVYRGCSHGCSYCFARPSHEFLGMSAGLDFETKIMVKLGAPNLLRASLMAAKYKPVTLAMSGVTDCYQPVEKYLKLTRQCLEILAEFRNPVSVITKNRLVTRDIDLLSELAKFQAAVVMISVTSLDPQLSAKMEPRASSPSHRLEAIHKLADAGVPVGVMVAPVIPGLTDYEVPSILKAAAAAGARFAGTVALRLPWAVAPIFEQWLSDHCPDRKEKVLNRVKSLRGGKLNDPNFGSRMRGEGIWAEQMKAVFAMGKREARINGPFPELSTTHFQLPGGQMNLW